MWTTIVVILAVLLVALVIAGWNATDSVAAASRHLKFPPPGKKPDEDDDFPIWLLWL